MTTTIKTPNTALDADIPRAGRAADAYEVACTALLLVTQQMLASHGPARGPGSNIAARHAVTLHRISGHLHRLAERACNEDLTCPTCHGEGALPGDKAKRQCRACAGHGTTVGRRLERLRRDATAIAEHYGLAVFFQTDPRGCSLYVGEAADMNAKRYDRGHAVARLGA